MMNSSKIRGVFYAVNGLGLGHLTRLLSIALELKKISNQNFEPFFFTTSEAAHILNAYNIPFIQLPSKPLAQRSGQFSFGKWARLVNSIFHAGFESIKPHALIVDTFPIGTARELEHILRYSSTFKVFIHRASKLDSYSREAIEAQRLYDLIIAPHHQDSVLIPTPQNFETEVFYSGPIFLTQKEDILSKLEAQKLLKLDSNSISSPKIYLTFGGGGDATAQITSQKITQLLDKHFTNAEITIGMGPLHLFKINASKYKEISIFPVAPYLKAFDFAIASSGYNTFHELLFAGIPTIFIPRNRGLDDQLARCQKATEQDAALFINEDDADFEQNFPNYLDKMKSDSFRQNLTHKAQEIIPENCTNKASKRIWDYFM